MATALSAAVFERLYFAATCEAPKVVPRRKRVSKARGVAAHHERIVDANGRRAA